MCQVARKDLSVRSISWPGACSSWEEVKGALQGDFQKHSCVLRQPFYEDICHEAPSAAPFHQVLTMSLAVEEEGD